MITVFWDEMPWSLNNIYKFFRKKKPAASIFRLAKYALQSGKHLPMFL
jgi:hypothetical protein